MVEFKEELIRILNNQIVEGLELIKKLNVTDKNYAEAIMNLLNAEKTAKALQSELDSAFATELLKDKEGIDVSTTVVEEGEK